MNSKKPRRKIQTLKPRVAMLDTSIGRPLKTEPLYELLTLDGYHPPRREEPRRNLKRGDICRLHVLVDLDHTIAPWVEIVERTPTGYIGKVGGIMNSADWLPFGTRVAFTFANIVELWK